MECQWSRGTVTTCVDHSSRESAFFNLSQSGQFERLCERFSDIVEACTHTVLFNRCCYPSDTFERKRKLGCFIWWSKSEALQSYIHKVKLSVKQLLLRRLARRIILCLLDSRGAIQEQTVFHLDDSWFAGSKSRTSPLPHAPSINTSPLPTNSSPSPLSQSLLQSPLRSPFPHLLSSPLPKSSRDVGGGDKSSSSLRGGSRRRGSSTQRSKRTTSHRGAINRPRKKSRILSPLPFSSSSNPSSSSLPPIPAHQSPFLLSRGRFVESGMCENVGCGGLGFLGTRSGGDAIMGGSNWGRSPQIALDGDNKTLRKSSAADDREGAVVERQRNESDVYSAVKYNQIDDDALLAEFTLLLARLENISGVGEETRGGGDQIGQGGGWSGRWVRGGPGEPEVAEGKRPSKIVKFEYRIETAKGVDCKGAVWRSTYLNEPSFGYVESPAALSSTQQPPDTAVLRMLCEWRPITPPVPDQAATYRNPSPPPELAAHAVDRSSSSTGSLKLCGAALRGRCVLSDMSSDTDSLWSTTEEEEEKDLGGGNEGQVMDMASSSTSRQRSNHGRKRMGGIMYRSHVKSVCVPIGRKLADDRGRFMAAIDRLSVCLFGNDRLSTQNSNGVKHESTEAGAIVCTHSDVMCNRPRALGKGSECIGLPRYMTLMHVFVEWLVPSFY
eukprot:GHVQ01018559.1.p1 GENE.GHVQ01018559.1~~GHVQ01018559.1.p1  ORF type:complete len:667 (+),score=110.54 GHVQ01018559.1:554-2554(+)